MNAWAIASLIILPLALTEFGEVSPWLATKILRLGARFVGDNERRERYAEEWVAGIEATPGKLTKLLKALGICLYAVPRMRVQVRGDLYRWRGFRLVHAVAALCMPPVARRMAKKRAHMYTVRVRGRGGRTGVSLAVLIECVESLTSSVGRLRFIPTEQVESREGLRVTLDHKQKVLLLDFVMNSTSG